MSLLAVDTLRRKAAAVGASVGHVDDAALWRLIQATKNIEVAADALAMRPRPGWAADLVGSLQPKPGQELDARPTDQGCRDGA